MPVPAVRGGAVEYLIDLYLAYNEQHKLHDITVYSIADNATKHHPALSSTVNHYRYINPFTLWAKIIKKLQFKHNNYYNPSIEYYLHQALQDIRHQRYDIIIVENRPGYILKLKPLTDARCVLHLHNDFLNSHSKGAPAIVEGVDKIICVSDYITQQIPKGKDKSETVYNAIDVQHFLDAKPLERETIGLSKDDFVIVYSGRLNKDKGILPLVKVIGTLTDIPNLKLLVVGASAYGKDAVPTPFIQELQEVAVPIMDKIVQTGFIDYQLMPAYLKMANIAVVPSLWEEPFGLTVVEAMAAGLPLITTRSGGIPEICEGAAYIVERNDLTNQLANAIRKLHRHSELRQQLSDAAKQRVRQFDKDNYAKKFFKALITIIFLLLPLTINAQKGKLSIWLQERMNISKSQTMRRAENKQEMLTTAFVRTSETLTEEMLIEYGGTIYAQQGDISIITIPLSQIGRFIENPSVLRVEANRRADVTLDTVPLVSNILPAYQTTPRHQAFTGNGVVVGVVDIGFDLTHPTFYNNVSLSDYRIKAFWDQLAQRDQTPTPKLPVGREFLTANDILAQGCAVDGKSQGHGTHTTGIAAGSGYDSPYRGVAYESELCLVANAVTSDTAFIAPQDYYLYTSATDALSFKYIFDYAEQQGKPCVISFSEGYTPYMDDDDLLYNDFLERLIGPGRIFVASAGNESRELTYLEKPIGKEQAGAFLKTGGKAPLYRIKSDKPVALSLYAYKNSNTPTHQLHIAANDERWNNLFIDTLFIDSDTLAVAIESYPSAFDQQGMISMVQMYCNVALSKLPPIALVISGKEQQAAVIGSNSNALENLDTDPRWNEASLGHNILSPGCLKAPICVASTSHRTVFKNMEGNWVQHLFTNEEEGLWSPFSSVGPTLDGRNKPDVAAPGRCIVSAYSSYYLEEHPTAISYDVAHFDVNGRTYPWRVDSGTSMSTPVVAGIIALWLQAKPDLTRDDIMGIFQRTCHHPEEGLDYPNNKYGYGKIDAYRGLLDILGVTAVEEISQHEPQNATIWAQEELLHIVFNKIPDAAITLSIYSTAGTRIYQTSVTSNQQNVILPLPAIGKGIYIVQLGNLGSTLIRI